MNQLNTLKSPQLIRFDGVYANGVYQNLFYLDRRHLLDEVHVLLGLNLNYLSLNLSLNNLSLNNLSLNNLSLNNLSALHRH